MSSDDEQEVRHPAGGPGLRVDKWLWCARFFRTRGLAQAAVEGGHVQVNDERVKSSRNLRVGDRLRIRRGQETMDVEVTAIPARRGPAAEARACYRESEQSETARLHARELRRFAPHGPARRPDKRDRRELVRLIKNRTP